MNNLIELNEAAISLGYFALAFMSYFFIPDASFFKRLAIRWGDSESKPEIFVYLSRMLGFVLLGLIPGIFFPLFYKSNLTYYGVTIPSGEGVLLWWLIPLAIFLTVSLTRPEKGVNTAFYPQVRKEDWNLSRTLVNTLSWIIYLVGYEFAFRGLLFFTCLHAFGLIPAIMIIAAIYSISHIPKGAGEAFGAFFLGILLCVIAFYTGSFLIPFALHIILAVGNDLKAVAINPKMKFSWK